MQNLVLFVRHCIHLFVIVTLSFWLLFPRNLQLHFLFINVISSSLRWLVSICVPYFHLHLVNTDLYYHMLFKFVGETLNPTFSKKCTQLNGEANSRSPNQKWSLLLWNTKCHYHVDKSPPLVTLLSQMNPVLTLAPNILKIHLNTLLSISRSSKWSLTFRISN
jgi:hypothetical protein